MLSGKKLLLVGLYFFENLGDPLYMITTKKLLEQRYHAIVDIADIYGRKSLPTNNLKGTIEKKHFKNFFKKALVFVRNSCLKAIQPIKLRAMYGRMISGYDAVIVPGGGVVSLKKYPFHMYFSALQSQCKKNRIPFCMNAVGITTIKNSKLLHCKKWRRIINNATYFSGRDGIDILSSICGHPINEAACTAVLSNELMEISKQNDSDIIGVGVIKGDIFTSNGFDFSEDQLINFYTCLIKKLQKQGYKVKIFTNGFAEDRRIAELVQESLNDTTLLLEQAKNPKELVAQIATFSHIICARMHSAIIAFSLDIPTVLLAWGIKSKAFMKSAGAMEYVIDVKDLNSSYVIKKFEKVAEYGWDKNRQESLKKKSLESVDKMIAAICSFYRQRR